MNLYLLNYATIIVTAQSQRAENQNKLGEKKIDKNDEEFM